MLLAGDRSWPLPASYSAQRFFREGSFATRYAPPQMPDASFVICRLAYRSVRSEPSGIGWQTDYPVRRDQPDDAAVGADQDAGQPRRESAARTSTSCGRLDDTLFNCPFLVASDAGTIGFRDDEAERLRNYLLKGGFLWADDFWGSEAWSHWAIADRQGAAAGSEYPIEDVSLDDPMLHSLFEVKRFRRSPTSSSGGGAAGRRRRSAAPTATTSTSA